MLVSVEKADKKLFFEKYPQPCEEGLPPCMGTLSHK